MNAVTLSVGTADQVKRRLASAMRGEPQGSHISFASVELLWRVLTTKRWELLKAMTGAGELSIREAARRVGRDVKAVHGDIHALIDAGVVHQAKNGVIFPYDAVHVDFTVGEVA